MKINKIYSFLSILVIAFTLNSCVQDGDFSVPDVSVTEPNITTNLTIAKVQADLIQQYNSNQELTYTYRVNDTPTYVTGYVVSSDAAGNFYKKITVQDKIENPTAGVEVLVNNNTFNETYEVGRKVYIKLDGLSVTYDDGQSSRWINPTDAVPGKFTLGYLDREGRVDDIPSTIIRTQIVRSSKVESIIPTSLTVGNIEQKHVNTLVELNSAQFEKNELGRTFAGEPTDEFDGLRTIFECGTEERILLQTSTFASFKSNPLPTGKGAAKAILTKDFRAEFFVLVANSPADLDFTDATRCDPPVLDCTGGAAGTAKTVYEEDFTSLTNDADLTAAGWSNVNTNGGTNVFSSRSFGGNRYMQASAFRSTENPLEIWLVTPSINLDNSSDEVLTFDSKTGYNNGAALSVWVSKDYDGVDPTKATWLKVENATIANGPSSGYQPNFTNSGNVDLSCLSGNVHVAFRYLGGDGGITTTFQIDNVKVTGN
ncbi:MAG: DUF5689 domain-containing protein [Flavobacteriaceae bacterium]